MSLTAVSLFSGCGGFDWGLQQAGVDIIWANDIDKYAASAYKTILPDVPFCLSDISEIESFPKADILIGCYPCTGFSVAARRRWKDREERNLLETKGNFLYLEFLRALKQVKPKYFFVENVSGMVSAMDGWFFQQQLEGFRGLGYNPQAKLLKAIEYGLAQDRKRIFIVGIRKDICNDFQYNFPEPTHGPNTNNEYITIRDIIGHMELWPNNSYPTLPYHGHYLTRNRKRAWEQQSFTIVANLSHVPLHPMGLPMRYITKDTWELQGHENRRLSWQECRALQSLPDTLMPEGPLSAKYKVIGNAVPPIYASTIVAPVIAFENSI